MVWGEKWSGLFLDQHRSVGWCASKQEWSLFWVWEWNVDGWVALWEWSEGEVHSRCSSINSKHIIPLYYGCERLQLHHLPNRTLFLGRLRLGFVNRIWSNPSKRSLICDEEKRRRETCHRSRFHGTWNAILWRRSLDKMHGNHRNHRLGFRRQTMGRIGSRWKPHGYGTVYDEEGRKEYEGLQVNGARRALESSITVIWIKSSTTFVSSMTCILEWAFE